MTEQFKSVLGFEGLYEVSNLGNVKSLSRWTHNSKGAYFKKERILKAGINSSGYRNVSLFKNGVSKNITIHQLVAKIFLKHQLCGYKLVVNHIDFNPLNNNLTNLEIVTQRKNSNRLHLNSTSKYTGVSWNKKDYKWRSQIGLNGKRKYLGSFNCETSAHLAYQKALKEILK